MAKLKKIGPVILGVLLLLIAYLTLDDNNSAFVQQYKQSSESTKWTGSRSSKNNEHTPLTSKNVKSYVRLPPTVATNCSKYEILCSVKSNGTLRKQKVVTSRPMMRIDRLKMIFHRLVTTADGAEQCPEVAWSGKQGDGGYDVCMTPPFKPEPGNCLVYSFGINRDWSFDESIAKYCEVHSFDPSIGLQDHLHSPNVHFHNLGLWGQDIVDSHNWTLMSLSSIRRRLGHEKRPIDVLKVDVEGAEWPFLRDVTIRDPDQLSDVRQLMIELHTPRYRPTPMTTKDVVEITDYVNRLLTTGGGRFVIYRNRQRNGCCFKFSPLMPPTVRERCCHEVFLVNTRFAEKT